MKMDKKKGEEKEINEYGIKVIKKKRREEI